MLKLEGCEVANGKFRLKADLSVAAGQIVAVIGPSGGGKSTLVEAIAGFLPIERGDLFWNERSLKDLHPGQRPVAMLFQDGNLFPHLSAADNIGLGLNPALRLSPLQTETVAQALVSVGLAGLGDRKPAALSGGQRARVALARAMVQNRAILLLDEPFAALGPALKSEMLTLVRELARDNETTVLMVSHDPDDAKHIADQVVLVAEGRASAPVDTQELFANPPAALRAYLG